MSVEKLIISKESSSFTVLPNKVLQNLVHLDALGLWVYLASLPPTWEFYKDQLREHFGIGKDKLEKLLFILREHNLLTIESVRNAQGRFVHWHLHILSGNDFAQPKNPYKSSNLDENAPDTENPGTGKPLGWKQDAINKTKNKINNKSFNKTNTHTSASGDAHACVSSDDFGAFWEAYPVKKNKKRALGKWMRAKDMPPIMQLVEDIEKRKIADRHWVGGYIPHPSTYIDEQTWKEPITPIELKAVPQEKKSVQSAPNEPKCTVPWFNNNH
jgi:hypothetical protein